MTIHPEDVLTLVEVHDSLASLKLLLADARCDDVDRTDLMIRAAQVENREVVLYLLSLPEVDPSASDNEAIRSSACKGDYELVRELLSYSQVNPSAKDNEAIKEALVRGHAEVVRLILASSRFSMENMMDLDGSFGEAIERNRTEAIRVLLKDGRFDPSNLFFSRDLCKGGTLEMFRVLYDDGRVDWDIDENEALRTARKFNRTEMVELLLQDGRVQAEEQRQQRRRDLLGY